MAGRSEVNSKEGPGPVRTCLGCGKKQLKSLLLRLVLDAQHQVVLDRPRTAPGRGAYLCGPGCLEAALKKKAFGRALRTKGDQPPRTPTLDVKTLEEALRTSVSK